MTLYAVGRILKAFGVKGYIAIMPLTHSAERFERLVEIYVGADEHTAQRFAIDDVQLTAKGVLVKLRTVDDRTASEKLANRYVFVDESDVLPPPQGSFFVHDIVGCTVWMGDKTVGTVVEVFSQAQGLAQDIWVIRGFPEGTEHPKRYWLPAVKEIIERVDIRRRKIIVRGIEELASFEG